MFEGHWILEGVAESILGLSDRWEGASMNPTTLESTSPVAFSTYVHIVYTSQIEGASWSNTSYIAGQLEMLMIAVSGFVLLPKE